MTCFLLGNDSIRNVIKHPLLKLQPNNTAKVLGQILVKELAQLFLQVNVYFFSVVYVLVNYYTYLESILL